jgi:hypothetical protein
MVLKLKFNIITTFEWSFQLILVDHLIQNFGNLKSDDS